MQPTHDTEPNAGRLESLYLSVTDGKPETARTAHVKSILAQQNERLDDAAQLAGKALVLEPENADYQRQLGLVCAQAGWMQQSAQMLNRAVYLDPNDHEAWYMLGAVFERAKHLDQARVCYEQSLRLSPRYGRAHEGMSRLEGGSRPVGR